MSDITYEHIKAIAKLENDVKERDATIKQLQEENQRLKEALKAILPLADAGFNNKIYYGECDKDYEAHKLQLSAAWRMIES